MFWGPLGGHCGAAATVREGHLHCHANAVTCAFCTAVLTPLTAAQVRQTAVIRSPLTTCGFGRRLGALQRTYASRDGGLDRFGTAPDAFSLVGHPSRHRAHARPASNRPAVHTDALWSPGTCRCCPWAGPSRPRAWLKTASLSAPDRGTHPMRAAAPVRRAPGQRAVDLAWCSPRPRHDSRCPFCGAYIGFLPGSPARAERRAPCVW